MKCPSCNKKEGKQHLTLGLLPCIECQERHSKLSSPNQAVEIIPERIKSDRQEHGDSILQPHVKGELDKKWIDLWGKKAAKDRGFTEKEIKNAKYVSDGIRSNNYGMTYYKNGT